MSIWPNHYNYDKAGDVTSWTHPGGITLANTINSAQQMTQVQYSPSDSTHPANLVPSVTYTAFGAVSTLQNGCVGTSCTLQETYDYNNRLQPVRIQLGTTGTPNSDFCWVYNYYSGVANPATCTRAPTTGTSGNNGDVMGYLYQDNTTYNLGHTASYTYDSLNRLLTSVATGSVDNLTFAYNQDGSGRYGNMSCQVNGGNGQGVCNNLSFSAATNQITTTGFSYDAAGNLTQDGSTAPVTTYRYDAEGRPTSVTQGPTTMANLTYNAQGQVVSTVYPVYSNTKVEGVFDPAGHELGYYDGASGDWYDRDIWLAGRMIAQSYPSSWPSPTRFLHGNALHSDVQVSNQSGTVTYDIVYYPWGPVWVHGGPQGDSHFAGFQQNSAVPDAYPTPTRRYAYNFGRWLTPDPGGKNVVHLDDPQTWNMYAYVRNNPTTLTDPTGLQSSAGAEGGCTNADADKCQGNRDNQGQQMAIGAAEGVFNLLTSSFNLMMAADTDIQTVPFPELTPENQD